MIRVEVVNWDKYHPRKDVKKLHWFRLDCDIVFDPKLFGLDVQAKWLFVSLVAFCTREMNSLICLKADYLTAHSGVSNIPKYLKQLEEHGLVQIRTETCSTEHNITEHNTRKNVQTFAHELEEIYQTYPRKIGKKRGMSTITKKIKTVEELANFSQAVSNYSKHCEGKELNFIKHFSTFVNEWEDWLSPANDAPAKKEEVWYEFD